MAPSDISKMTVPVLRKELEKLGLDTSGLKAVLVERLTKARAEAAALLDRAAAADVPPRLARVRHVCGDGDAGADRPPAVRHMAPHSVTAAVLPASPLCLPPPATTPGRTRSLNTAATTPAARLCPAATPAAATRNPHTDSGVSIAPRPP